MSWRTLSTDDVLSEFTPAEQAVLGNLQQSSGTLHPILERVRDAARGVIRAAGTTLGDAGTLPDQVIPDVIAIARWRWLISLPQLKSMQTEERKLAAQEAQKRLDEIAKGTIPVEPADDTATAAGTGPSLRDKTLSLTRDEQEGT